RSVPTCPLRPPWPISPPSASFRVPRAPQPVATVRPYQSPFPRITPLTRTEHLSLKPVADRSPVRGFPCDPWPEVCCHASHGPKIFATDHTDHTAGTSLSPARGRPSPAPPPSLTTVAPILPPARLRPEHRSLD